MDGDGQSGALTAYIVMSERKAAYEVPGDWLFEGQMYRAGRGHRLEKERGVGGVGVCRGEGRKDGLTIV